MKVKGVLEGVEKVWYDRKLHEDLVACMGSCEWVEFALSNKNDDMSKRSADAQISTFESNSTNILSSVDSNLTVVTKGMWTMMYQICLWTW